MGEKKNINMNNYGIGIDIVCRYRIKKIFKKFGNKLINKILSPKELILFHNSMDKISFISKRFAVKESISKSLGTGIKNNIKFNDFELLNNNIGKPIIHFLGHMKNIIFILKKQYIYVSITDEKKYILAITILK